MSLVGSMVGAEPAEEHSERRDRDGRLAQDHQHRAGHGLVDQRGD